MTPLDPRTEETWHARGGHASDDADHDEALERQGREREKQDRPPPFIPLPSSVLSDERGHRPDEPLKRDVALLAFAAEPRAWGRCQACYRYSYRKRTGRGLVCYRCR